MCTTRNCKMKLKYETKKNGKQNAILWPDIYPLPMEWFIRIGIEYILANKTGDNNKQTKAECRKLGMTWLA